MAKKIQSSDIFEGELLKVLIDEIAKAEKKLDGLSDKLKGVGDALKKELGVLDLKSLENIQKLLDKTKELQKATDDAYKLEKERLKLENQKAILQEKLADTKKKYQLDEEQRLKKIADAEAKKLAKEKKTADDLANAYKQLEKNTRELKNESKKLGAEMLELEKAGQKNTKAYRDLEKQYDEVTKSALEGDRALKKLDSQVGDNFRSVGNYERALGGLKNAFSQLGVAFGAFEIGKYFVDTQVKLDSLKLALQNVSGTTKEYQANFAFLRTLSQSYGQDLLRLVDTYKNFIASTNESNLTLGQRKRIYESIVKAGSALALSNDDVQGTLRAVQQMFSKGTVQAEELRQQLGDRLPGAFGIMAKAVGVSEAELGKMMKNGEVLTDDIMPRFAILLEQEFGDKASKNLQTLSGSLNVLRTNLTLYFDKAQSNFGVNKILSSLFLGIANNIGFLLRNLTDLGIAIATYKALVLGAEIRTSLLGKSFKEVVSGAFSASEGVKAFGISLRSITFVVLIDGLVKVIEKIVEFTNATDLARKTYALYQDSITKGNKKANDFLTKIEDDFSKKQKKLRDDRKKGLITEKQLKDELAKAEVERTESIIDKMGELQRSIKYAQQLRQNARSENEGRSPVDVVRLQRENPDDFSISRHALVYNEALANSYIKLGANINDWSEQLSKYQARLDRYKTLNEGSGNKVKNEGKDIPSTIQNVVELNTKFNETNRYISRQAELLKDIKKIQEEIVGIPIESTTNKILEEQRKLAEEKGYYDSGKITEAIYNDTQQKIAESEALYLSKKNDAILKAEKDTAEERAKVEEQYQEKKKGIEKKYDKFLELKRVVEENKDKNLSKTAEFRNKEKEYLKLKKDKEAFDKAMLELDKNYKNEIAIIDQNEIDRKYDAYLESEKQLKEHEKRKLAITTKADETYLKNIEENDKAVAEYRLEQIKKLANTTNDLIQLALESYIRTIEDKIKLLDDRMNRIAQTSQYLQNKAIAGNITAQESLAKAEKDQVEAEKEKVKYQRSIQRLQIALAIFNAYNNNIQNAKVGENAFAKTITDVSMLSTFVNSIPQFYTGTNTTVEDALGKPQLSGRDGHIVRVDGSEKILNPYLSQKTGDLTTFEIAKIAEDRLKGKLVYNTDTNTGNNMWASIKLIDEIQDLKNIIKSKPETNIAMGEIVGGVMKIVESTKVNNTTTRNIHRFNKKI